MPHKGREYYVVLSARLFLDYFTKPLQPNVVWKCLHFVSG